MDEEVVQQIVEEVFSSLEPLDTQGAALTEFLKSKGIVSDEELAPFLKVAGNTSSVRWLAARVRIKSLIASAMNDMEKKPDELKTGESEAEKKKEEPKGSDGESSDGRGHKKPGPAGAKDHRAQESEGGQAQAKNDSQNAEAEVTKDKGKKPAENPAPVAEKNGATRSDRVKERAA